MTKSLVLIDFYEMQNASKTKLDEYIETSLTFLFSIKLEL